MYNVGQRIIQNKFNKSQNPHYNLTIYITHLSLYEVAIAFLIS